MKNSFLDYQIFPTPELNEFSAQLTGTNIRQVLVGFFDEQSVEREDYLKKIMSAAKFNLPEDCLILRGSHETKFPSFIDLKRTHNVDKAVLFGIKPSDLGLNLEIPLYQPIVFNKCVFLFVDKISVIEPSKERRAALWVCLQKIFL
ncbi:MAG: hypothetical protein U5L45_25600 [Saprospiraceae bacterium]|nr:hypothetical protein [Saprospiraceae bacterium]